MSATPTVRAESPVAAPDAPYLRAPRLPSGIALPVATWDRHSLRCTVTEGAVESVWSGTAIYRDMRPGPSGYELVDISCESTTPTDVEPSEAARECAERMLDKFADEIGGAR